MLGHGVGNAFSRLATRLSFACYLAGIFWLTSPYLFFFERMALADIEAGAMVVLLALFLLPDVRFPRKDLLAGLALGAALLFKVSTAPFAGVPILSLLLERDQLLSTRAKRLLVIYGVALTVVAPAVLYTSTRGGFFSIARNWVGEPVISLAERTARNTQTFLDTTITVDGLWTLVLVAAPLAILVGRRGTYLLGSVIGPLAVMIVFGTEVLDRHFGVIMPLLTVAAAVGWTGLLSKLSRLDRREHFV